jgi:hypothetical protein
VSEVQGVILRFISGVFQYGGALGGWAGMMMYH